MDGQPKSKKITYFSNFSKTIRYFFLVVSRPLRRVFKTFSEKNSKKNKIFILSKKFRTIFFSAIFSNFLSKKVYFSNITRYFFLLVSLPLRRVLKTFSEKNSKKIKNFKFVQKFRTIFFQRFLRFFDVCSRVDLVNFLEVFSSGVLEEISLFTFFLDSS